MKNILLGALAYTAIVFAVGVVVGAARILWLTPQLGELRAVLVELPFMLAFAWVVCGAVMGWFGAPQSAGARLALGGAAFVFLMLAEFALAVIGFGAAPGDQMTTYLSAPGLIGLFGQMAFALFPLLRLQRSRAPLSAA